MTYTAAFRCCNQSSGQTGTMPPPSNVSGQQTGAAMDLRPQSVNQSPLAGVDQRVAAQAAGLVMASTAAKGNR